MNLKTLTLTSLALVTASVFAFPPKPNPNIGDNTPEIQKLNLKIVGTAEARLKKVEHVINLYNSGRKFKRGDERYYKKDRIRYNAYDGSTIGLIELAEARKPLVFSTLYKYSFINNYDLITSDWKYFKNLDLFTYHISLLPYSEDGVIYILQDKVYPSIFRSDKRNRKKELSLCRKMNNFQLEVQGLSGEPLKLANKLNSQAKEFCDRDSKKWTISQ